MNPICQLCGNRLGSDHAACMRRAEQYGMLDVIESLSPLGSDWLCRICSHRIEAGQQGRMVGKDLMLEHIQTEHQHELRSAIALHLLAQ